MKTNANILGRCNKAECLTLLEKKHCMQEKVYSVKGRCKSKILHLDNFSSALKTHFILKKQKRKTTETASQVWSTEGTPRIPIKQAQTRGKGHSSTWLKTVRQSVFTYLS